MKAAIYIRVSTQEQADEGYSVGAQTERLTAYCKAKGWTVYQTYTDGGFSGSNTDRPALDKLIKDVKKKKVDIVIVYKLDRLSRSQKDTLYLIEDVFLKYGVGFVSMNENFDTSTPFGRAMIGILSVFAQLEREQIKERTSMGRIERAKDGYFHGGGYTPIGYDYIDGELVVNEYEAMQIREVYALFLKGTPIERIRSIMNSKKYTTKYGSWGNHSAVRNAITQKIYTGKIEWRGEVYEGRHEAIISEDLFAKAQKRYESISWTRGSGEHKARPFQAKYLLTGLIICGNCGARYFAKGNYSGRGENKRYHPYYTCYSRSKSAKNMIIDPDCKNKSYAVTKLDPLIMTEVRKLAYDPEYFREIQSTPKPVLENDNAVIEARVAEIDKQVARLLDLYQLGTIPTDQLADRVEGLNAEKAGLIDQLDDDDEHIPALSILEAEHLLKGANDILTNGSLEDRRTLVHSLIDHIDMVGEDIVIHWAFV